MKAPQPLNHVLEVPPRQGKDLESAAHQPAGRTCSASVDGQISKCVMVTNYKWREWAHICCFSNPLKKMKSNFLSKMKSPSPCEPCREVLPALPWRLRKSVAFPAAPQVTHKKIGGLCGRVCGQGICLTRNSELFKNKLQAALHTI